MQGRSVMRKSAVWRHELLYAPLEIASAFNIQLVRDYPYLVMQGRWVMRKSAVWRHTETTARAKGPPERCACRCGQ